MLRMNVSEYPTLQLSELHISSCLLSIVTPYVEQEWKSLKKKISEKETGSFELWLSQNWQPGNSSLHPVKGQASAIYLFF